ncbi:hypothetical protein LTR16_002549 [Cryomyces antarcticus]|uniref:Uncharacterized protein n=1 Tax=Cryomyces antarcticus TaxID=329879 RepID=A0ABR0LYI6_9PEZI|nr:hypothetical protein LTR39_001791 [Cryomyces antarcticus]KAK5018006.1 hypothetical protein LTR60_001688 [Cryomyces antarcticus]KAK5256729.1 hypothetical protein LTR16_002549 [Cryomyces antarcticus]
MSRQEQDDFLNSIAAWNDSVSVRSSASEQRRHFPADSGSPTSTNGQLGTTSNASSLRRIGEEGIDLDRALDSPDFRALRTQQEEERDRFVLWASRQKRDLFALRERRRQELQDKQEKSKDDLLERQFETFSKIEDKHVSAELDLRRAHEQEHRNCAIALRHMEAYCKGLSLDGTPTDRAVTDQDRRELEKQYWTRDHLEAKHSSAINVLRGEQAMRLKLRQRNQEAEVAQLERTQVKDVRALEQTLVREEQELEDAITKRKTRLTVRWDVQTEIMRKDLEKQTGVSFASVLPPIDWPDPEANLASSTSTLSFSSTESRLSPPKTAPGISTHIALHSNTLSS